MATTNLTSKTIGDIRVEHGSGAPDHTSPKGSRYTDVATAKLYENTDGATTWVEIPNLTVVNAAIAASLSSVASSVATTGATPTEIDKIDTLTAEGVHLVMVDVTCKSDDDAKFGSWSFLLQITKLAGVAAIQVSDVIHHQSSTGLTANSVTFTANAGDVDIDVTGIAVTNIQWDCDYHIKTVSTN